MSLYLDQQGCTADLPDGVWNLQIEMLCFTTLKQEVAVAPNAPSPEWELKMQGFDEIKAFAPAPARSHKAASAPWQRRPGGNLPNTNPSPVAVRGGCRMSAKERRREDGCRALHDHQRADAQQRPAKLFSNAPGGGGDEAFPRQAMLMVNGSVSNGIERRAIGNARKGPGSAYRGDFSTVVDNSALNARNFSITGQDTPRAAAASTCARRHACAGPLAIPAPVPQSVRIFRRHFS